MRIPGSSFPILLVTAAAVAATAVALPADATPAPQRAAAKPAESTRVLPDVATISSAVDNAGGSLVVGHSLHGSGPGIRAYYRTPSGTWRNSAQLMAESAFPGTLVETAAAAGPSGFYVVAWRFAQGGQRSIVYASIRSTSGTFSKPKLVSDLDYSSGTDAAARLRLATNDNGDAVITQRTPRKIVRYTRSTNTWHGYLLALRDGESDQSFRDGLHKHDAVVTMSAARSIDVTFAYGPTATQNIYQRTLTEDSTSFTPTIQLNEGQGAGYDSFDIAMDANGLQTLILSDGLTLLYRQQTRRGPFISRTEELGDASAYNSFPHVAARGDYNRVTFVNYCGCDGEYDLMATRLYKGDTAVSGGQTLDGAEGTQNVQRPLAIGTDGRGVEITFGTETADERRLPESTVQRSLLEASGRTDQIMSRGSLEPPALDVGRTSVSQLVIHEAVKSGGRTVRRTVVYVRR